MRTAVIIPSYGAATGLRRCIRSVGQAIEHAGLDETSPNGPVEIVVVHSGKWDPPAGTMEGLPYARLIRVAERLFPGPARNRGAQETQAELLFFTDNDCTVSRDWFAAHLAAHTDGAKAVTGPVLPGPAGAPRGWPEYLIEFARMSRPRGRPDNAPACNVSYRRDVLEAAGWFPALRAGEELLLNLRMADRGLAHITPSREAVVHHYCRVDPTEFKQNRVIQGEGLAMLTRVAEREGLLKRQATWEYRFLAVICRSPGSLPLIGAKLARLLALSLRGQWHLGFLTLRHFPTVLKGLWTEARACRRAWRAGEKS